MTPAGDFRSILPGRHDHLPDAQEPLRALARHRAALPRAALPRPVRARACLITIGFSAIAALGLNILVGFTGQISIGHAAFFGFGAFASAWLHEYAHIPVALCIPLAGLMTTAVGLVFGLPAARLKGSTSPSPPSRRSSSWRTSSPARRGSPAAWRAASPSRSASSAGSRTGRELLLRRPRLGRGDVPDGLEPDADADGRALVAVRDHYLSAEMMGINLAYYRTLSFGIASFYAGIGGALYAHYLLFVSVEAFNILFSIQFSAWSSSGAGQRHGQPDGRGFHDAAAGGGAGRAPTCWPAAPWTGRCASAPPSPSCGKWRSAPPSSCS
jgi:branched-chain amino acid transport system permease protein